ncbi:beta-N-acetylhexosaminidase [Actinacidiphila alni]|uniref:beta-N-acetylhexosaminidase n=1 Tax=Actinacidiphila alni TaxID=380248 RepID=A0A1I2BWK5_9ACTN|nr:glycoside hydrolase family 3 N-terminal domain-containing protein [Actinacidiphila alni]SFE59720.1 beta-N-acetylhexosaminidase [Actinacidiphila alni]
MRLPTPSAASRPSVARRRGAGLALGLMVTLAACSSGGGGDSSASVAPSSATASPSPSPTTTSPSARPSPTPTRPTTTKPPVAPPAPTTTKAQASCVDRTADAMTTAQRVGQLFMAAVTSTGMTGTESAAVSQGRVGAVFLMGHTTAGTAAVKSVTDRVRTLATSVKGAHLGLLIATDQEGGQVQVLGGPGFSAIPDAVTQGQWPASRLQQEATGWAKQLRAAGVNMNLAPVADTVPPDLVKVNGPIGELNREYGNDPATVATHSDAFLRGMRAAGVVPTVKHFPGLGRVRGNTDFTAGVTDTVTTTTDPYLQPFRSAVQAGTPFVMVSSATYSRIDGSRQAVFSPVVLRDLLRGRLGFQGAVISDDIGAAVAVSDRSPAQRALDFLAAGGNMVLTVRPGDIAPMTSAVINRLPKDAALRKDVDDSLHRVLTAKRNAGLLTC